MGGTLEAARLDDGTRKALLQFFLHSSTYVAGKEAAAPGDEELAERWVEQRNLDDAIGAIAANDDHRALALAPQFASRPSVFIGLLARMAQSGRAELIRFVIDAVEREPSLTLHRFAGRTLLHVASGAGCLDVIALLLRFGMTQTCRTGAAIHRFTARQTNARRQPDPRQSGCWCEPVQTLMRAAASPGRLRCTWRHGEGT